MSAESLVVEPRRRVTLDEVRLHRDRLLAANDEDSDLDLLVDVAPGRGSFALGAFAFAVPDLKIRMCDRVLAEAVPV